MRYSILSLSRNGPAFKGIVSYRDGQSINETPQRDESMGYLRGKRG